ncbi:MAG: isoleucine--tRNA ligase [Actinobacteria bacterium]|nr:isoleucine--tRNA ligase [Actinomycetota bacterium]MCG2819170.1 isoleucine--tRNA ligase [Actinomycetes bacterium]MBU4219039.1 isoleucine--tRNA ligase [Actinomycetota bacterium]MBU4359227.1 isoleucine--tRNA ligase [Actinomycetota bacterium]MBU4391542.1 isoleucine--tRNA ligase [Actinomycetota bacterium]
MDYKETLNLPKMVFPMKGNLASKEPEIQEYWEDIHIYDLILEKGEGRPLFILHDGPPYANGDIHVGTAYNKIIKDIIVKYKTMRGFRCPYVPGWDCHGQPIEHEVTKRLGADSDVDKVELRAMCRAYAMEYMEKQREQFKRLGVLGEFKDPYLTLAPSYEATNVDVFGELYRKGLIYKGRKPIHWCTNCVTALAEAELEYEDKESHSIYVKFPLTEEFTTLTRAGKPVSLVIWTTTPWTLPANVAVALSGRLPYVGVDTGEEILVMARDMVEGVMEEMGVGDYKATDTFTGPEMEGLHCRHPWNDRDSVVVLAPYVTLEQGTGCVHIAPGHGQEDYLTGLEYDLPDPMPVDDLGRFTSEAGQFAGMSLDKANPEILKDLRDRGLLLAAGTVTHPYPHCWRCKQPVVFRATPQWFIALDKEGEGPSLRQEAMDAIRGVEWIPEWTANRIGSMVESRPDWCISRQRAWGVPLPVLYCRGCGREMVNDETLSVIRAMFEAEGADAWFTRDPEGFLPEGTACPECGGRSFEKETDILDVWFESGISHLAVLRKRNGLRWPADLYVEGSDQHRGWFQSSLLLSVGVEGRPPFDAVLTHGFTVDGFGRKMSKSEGNAIDPREVYERSGAEILRLWTAATDYSSDMSISEEILAQSTESYRRIRNTLRFLIGNTSDFDPGEHTVPTREMEEIDRWMVGRIERLVENVTSLMDRWNFHQAVGALNLFCTVELSSLYLDVLKDRLYTFPADSRERRSAQSVLFSVLEKLNTMIAPVLAHTAEEAFQAIPVGMRAEKSVHLLPWPEYDPELVDVMLEEKWGRLIEVREDVYRALEEARRGGVVGTGLEASVKILADGTLLELLAGMEDQLPELFIVSQVEVTDSLPPGVQGSETGGVTVVVEKASGEKCRRCWNYSPSVGSDPENPDICQRCVATLEKIAR